MVTVPGHGVKDQQRDEREPSATSSSVVLIHKETENLCLRLLKDFHRPDLFSAIYAVCLHFAFHSLDIGDRSDHQHKPTLPFTVHHVQAWQQILLDKWKYAFQLSRDICIHWRFWQTFSYVVHKRKHCFQTYHLILYVFTREMYGDYFYQNIVQVSWIWP